MGRVFLFFAVVIFCCGPVLAEDWGKEHPRAASSLAKVMDKNPEFRKAFASFTHDHPERAKHFITYLTNKEGRTIKTYTESQDKKNEAFRHLVKIKKKYPVRMARLREWAQNHRKPARHLFQQDGAVRYLKGGKGSGGDKRPAQHDTKHDKPHKHGSDKKDSDDDKESDKGDHKHKHDHDHDKGSKDKDKVKDKDDPKGWSKGKKKGWKDGDAPPGKSKGKGKGKKNKKK